MKLNDLLTTAHFRNQYNYIELTYNYDVVMQNPLLNAEFTEFIDSYEPYVDFGALSEYPLSQFPYQCVFFLQIDKGLAALEEE